MSADFEQGPIRPPSEAKSLLLRCTRNCPWNRCEFCHTYRGEKFSLRTVEEIKSDIDAMRALRPDYRPESAFLQDANSLIMRTPELAEALSYLRLKFPSLKRITSYARAHTVRRKTVEELRELKEAGLARIHIGMESGSDEVLKMMQKGVTKADHIEAGVKAVRAGMELSEYVMPGLGGRRLSRTHALETAGALNAINPHFIRLRTLAPVPGAPLFEKWRNGDFERLSDDETVHEIRLMVSMLDGIGSFVVSDHILNLLEELEGLLPGDRDKLLGIIDRYLGMPDGERLLFKFGRRAGRYRELDDLAADPRRTAVEGLMRTNGIVDEESYEGMVSGMMMNFV